ncbi:MAG: hypothetical protein CSA34_01955 [Desulfobulbus propionicus]|nr:MAG: hypothetical protein CSA34_01955 [Desulfobulbus propionicus]
MPLWTGQALPSREKKQKSTTRSGNKDGKTERQVQDKADLGRPPFFWCTRQRLPAGLFKVFDFFIKIKPGEVVAQGRSQDLLVTN